MGRLLRELSERLASAIGALPAKRVTWGLVLLFSVWVVLDVLVFRITGGLNRSTYDTMVRYRIHAAAPDPRIVIVDIDEASLARMGKEFGRWPWPRDTLATALDYIEGQEPAAVVWDVVFSDGDRLNPGGDAAFDQAARRSAHSHFSVVRLPAANDMASQITRAVLPRMWYRTPAPAPVAPAPAAAEPAGSASAPQVTVALIPPALPALAAARLGFNNGYVDRDGVLRRYRYAEQLADGAVLQSIPLSVLDAIDGTAGSALAARASSEFATGGELIAWRQGADAYPRVSFADVFAQAEGARPLAPVPGFAGKLVIIGSTAPSLHDIHPTPLSPMQAGVDALATALDNAVNQRHLAELPRWLQAVVAIALCVAIALWAQLRSVASLAPALFALPATLMAVSYLSLNGAPIFLDLHLAAALALVFLAVLRYWSALRRNYWCAPPPASTEALAVWPWLRHGPWLDDALDRLIDAVEKHAPACRVVVCDASVNWPQTLRWPELARFAAVVGPVSAMAQARAQLEPALLRLARRSAEPIVLEHHPDREILAASVFTAGSNLQKRVTSEQ